MVKYATLTKKEMSDSGQALVLICLILSLILGGRGWVVAALVFLILNMAWPVLFRPFAFVWLNFSHVLGSIVSRIILTLEFFLLVIPIGLIRRAMGKDTLALKKWKKGEESVFVARDHLYQPDDLKNPY